MDLPEIDSERSRSVRVAHTAKDAKYTKERRKEVRNSAQFNQCMVWDYLNFLVG